MTSPIYNYYMRDRIPESVRNEIRDINKQITLQNKCFSILHKSQLTHNNTVTKQFVISYSGSQIIAEFIWNTIYVFNTDNFNDIIRGILVAAENVTKYKQLRVTMSIYTINNIDYKLIDNINVLDMIATKKEVLLSLSPETHDDINMQIISDNNIPMYIIPLLKLIVTLNKLRTHGNKTYIKTYYKNHNLSPTKLKCLPLFIGMKKTLCINHCITNINAWLDKNVHSKQKTNTPMQHISIV